MRELQPTNRTRGILATLAARFAAIQQPVETPTKPSGGIPFAARHRKEHKAGTPEPLAGTEGAIWMRSSCTYTGERRPIRCSSPIRRRRTGWHRQSAATADPTRVIRRWLCAEPAMVERTLCVRRLEALE